VSLGIYATKLSAGVGVVAVLLWDVLFWDVPFWDARQASQEGWSRRIRIRCNTWCAWSGSWESNPHCQLGNGNYACVDARRTGSGVPLSDRGCPPGIVHSSFADGESPAVNGESRGWWSAASSSGVSPLDSPPRCCVCDPPEASVGDAEPGIRV